MNHAAINKGASNYLGNICACALSRSASSNSLRPRGLWPARLLCPWDFPGENTAVGCHSLLRGIFPGVKCVFPRLLCWQVGSAPLRHQGSHGLAGPRGNFGFTFSGVSRLFCRGCTSGTSASWGFQLLHIHTNGMLFSFLFLNSDSSPNGIKWHVFLNLSIFLVF